MAEQTIELGWGTGKVTVALGGHLRPLVVAPEPAEPARDPEKKILSALREPDAGPSLEKLCGASRRVLIVVSDGTRVTGAQEFLPVLVRFIKECGVPEEGIQLIVATGMHAPAGRERLEAFLPPEITQNLSVTEHDCRDEGAHFYAGSTSRGTRVHLNKRAAEADLVVLTGSIGLHYFAGFRGGRKSVLPGIAALSSICSNHRLTISGESGFHPLCRNASLDGNPVHEDMLESLTLIPPSFLLNTIVDAEGRVLSLHTGDPVEAHLRGSRELQKRVQVAISGKADCAVVSCGGYPRDSTLIQSHKSVENASVALKDGGSMVVLAKCQDGIGSDTLLSWFEDGSIDSVRRKLVSHYTLHGHTALSMMEKAKRFHIHLVSDLKDDVVRRTGFVPSSSVEKAMEEVLKREKGSVTTLVFPEGSETLPVARE
ncbi:MAG: nickel-dependent lactate racemase [Candidatus Eiseniibacteriota bacterium]|nr:MAG: nickel-dependent lactate racemase [Candidatus Eisenbacteria bacterium]